MWGDSRCLRVFKSGKLDLKITWTMPQVPSVSWCVSLASCDMIKWYWDGYTWCSDKYNIQQTLMITSETEKKKWGMARDPGNMTFGLTLSWHVQIYCRVDGTGETFMESDATLGFIYIWKSEKIFRLTSAKMSWCGYQTVWKSPKYCKVSHRILLQSKKFLLKLT